MSSPQERASIAIGCLTLVVVGLVGLIAFLIAALLAGLVWRVWAG